MKWIKICALLFLTLTVMRAGSWAVDWAMNRLVAVQARTAAALSNAVAFGAYLSVLYFSSLPGEPVDWAAVVFGFVVFGIYAIADLFWHPWKHRGSASIHDLKKEKAAR